MRIFKQWMAVGVVALCLPLSAQAQQSVKQLPPVTLNLQDAPIRSALEQIFRSANVDYTLDNNVQGFVTLKITEQPFENALKLILRAATVPLTYTVENHVYIVKPRALPQPATTTNNTEPDVPETRSANFERIELTYLDPLDLAGALGINVFLRYYTRQGMGGGMGMGGMGGGMGMGGMGMGGMGGGMGMGGMGGGMGMGGMGGGMGMGGMGGGMMGGMGGGMGMGGMGGGMGGFGGGFGGGRGF